MSALPDWDDNVADLTAFVAAARTDGTTEATREALGVLAGNCDRDGVLAAAVKLLAELCEDLDLCSECFRAYAVRAIARA
jgi:hypothetical protein